MKRQPQLLDSKYRELSANDFEDVTIIALQHLLPSIECLVSRIIKSGVASERIFFIGKKYSTIPKTKKRLREEHGISVHSCVDIDFTPGEYSNYAEKKAQNFWEMLCTEVKTINVVLIDEGGLLRKTMPHKFLENGSRKLVAVEHTSSGWHGKLDDDYPLILKARCFAKLKFESIFIVEALVSRLLDEVEKIFHVGNFDKNIPIDSVALLRKLPIGIIGFGFIGRMLAKHLHSLGVNEIYACDSDKDVFAEMRHIDHVKRAVLSDLVAKSSIVFGCTGHEISGVEKSLYAGDYQKYKDYQPGMDKKIKVFASCSSGDREFGSIIKILNKIDRNYKENPLINSTGEIGQYRVTLLNGGFPLNFDRIEEREPPIRINLTRELTFASIIQGLLMLKQQDLKPRAVMLAAEFQISVFTSWLHSVAEELNLPILDYYTPSQCEIMKIPFSPALVDKVWEDNSEGEVYRKLTQ